MEHNRKWDWGVSGKIYWQASRRFFGILAFGPNNKMRKYTLLVLLVCGLAGVLIDLDHLLITETQMVRPLHLPIWIALCFVCIGYYAYIHRWVYKSGIK